MDLRIFSHVIIAESSEDEVPQCFSFRKDLILNSYPEETIVKGTIMSERFYADPEHEVLICKADYTYIFDEETGMIVEQLGTVTHYWEDGSECEESFDFHRVYTPREQMKLLKTRRATVRIFLEAAVLNLLVATGMEKAEAFITGGQFLVLHSASMSAYEASGSPQFSFDLQAANDPWLDNEVTAGVTIRDYILSEIS